MARSGISVSFAHGLCSAMIALRSAARQLRGVAATVASALPTGRSASAPLRIGRTNSTQTAASPSTSSVQSVPAALDTHKLVAALQARGFTPQQAEVVVETFVDVLEHNLVEQKKQLATKFEFVNLKSELQLLSKSDFVLLKNDLALLEKKAATEMANVRTDLERIENRFIKWAVGASITVTAAMLGYSRLKS